MRTKILITGNAGMIGSVLADFFISRGYYVIGIDDLSGGFLRNVNPSVKFYPVSILDVKSINNIFEIEKPDYVINCACFAAECLSPFIRNFIYQNIVVGTANLINASVNNSIKKFIHFSSIARYGNGEFSNCAFKEHFRPLPQDCYGFGKYINELDLKESYEHFGLKYSIVAPHNCISERQNYFDKYRNVVSIFIRQCLNNENITLFGDGFQKRSFSDCNFLCEPIEKLLYECNTELFNLGSDKITVLNDLAELVLKIAHEKMGFCNSDIIHLPPRLEVKDAIADHSKAKNILGFKDETNLEDLVSRMFDYAITLPKQEVKKMNYEITKNLPSSWL